MDELFKSYCAFGAKDAAPLMDNAKFAKFARETKILDKRLLASDIDIIFSKVKGCVYQRTFSVLYISSYKYDLCLVLFGF